MSYLQRAQRFGKARISLGYRRVVSSIIPALQMTICAICAYAFCERVLHHQAPIFAATSSMIALGFVKVPRVRRVLEFSIGCTLGIAIGDLVMLQLGQGLWQASLVLFFSVLIARFLDSGSLFTQQLGLQAALVVLLPQLPGGVFHRSIDTVVGGSFALLLTIALSVDPRREPRQSFKPLLSSLANSLRTLTTALAENNQDKAWKALSQSRAASSMIDLTRALLTSAYEVARLSPTHRHHRREVKELDEALTTTDFALRNCRIYARRVASCLGNAAFTEDARKNLSQQTADIADAVESLKQGITANNSDLRTHHISIARDQLHHISHNLHPDILGISSLEGTAAVTLLRPMVVDLLQATGLSHERAKVELPDLD